MLASLGGLVSMWSGAREKRSGRNRTLPAGGGTTCWVDFVFVFVFGRGRKRGTTADASGKTLPKINITTLVAGDKILLNSAEPEKRQLWPQGPGTQHAIADGARFSDGIFGADVLACGVDRGAVQSRSCCHQAP
jgi:hypothetical protein